MYYKYCYNEASQMSLFHTRDWVFSEIITHVCAEVSCHACRPGQDIRRHLCNPKAHYHVHKSPLLSRILCRLTSVHNPRPYIFTIHLISTPIHALVCEVICFLQVFQLKCTPLSLPPCVLHAPLVSLTSI
jgi:hypothetical protein